MITKTITILDPLQCPLCHEADQHAETCKLNGKRHIYFDEWQGLVDWKRTFVANQINIPNENRQRRKL